MQIHDATMFCVLPQLSRSSKQMFGKIMSKFPYLLFSFRGKTCFGIFVFSSVHFQDSRVVTQKALRFLENANM